MTGLARTTLLTTLSWFALAAAPAPAG